jgi:hypothetical protein
MPALPKRGRFIVGFIAGAVLAAAATAGAQGQYVLLAGGYGLPPGGTGFVICTDPTRTQMLAGVTPTTGLMPMLANGVRQNALTIRC